MTASDRPPPQLALPVIPPTDPSSTDGLLQHVTAQLGGLDLGDALVHLRCSTCAWSGTVRLPGRARATARVERMLPRVPVRHWVFSLGRSAQPRLAAHAGLRTRVARACVGAVFGWLRRAAGRVGLPAPVSCGAISAIHRVDAALETNVHVHALVLDGVYTREPDGTPVFHPLPPPRRRDLRRTLAELRAAIEAVLARAPVCPPPTRATAVHRMAMGPVVTPVHASSAAALLQRCGELDVRAGPIVEPDDRALRARLCRYVTRAPFDPAALVPGDEGRLRYRLRHPFADGTTHVELSPRALAERLSALAAGELRPPVGFHGMLAPGAAAAWLGPRPRQLPLLEPSDRPRRVPRAPTPPILRCRRCDGTLDIVGVESAEPRAA